MQLTHKLLLQLRKCIFLSFPRTGGLCGITWQNCRNSGGWRGCQGLVVTLAHHFRFRCNCGEGSKREKNNSKWLNWSHIKGAAEMKRPQKQHILPGKQPIISILLYIDSWNIYGNTVESLPQKVSPDVVTENSLSQQFYVNCQISWLFIQPIICCEIKLLTHILLKMHMKQLLRTYMLCTLSIHIF